MSTHRIVFFLASIVAGILVPASSKAASTEAVVRHHRGLAALSTGQVQAAASHFEAACLADEGVGEACLEWAGLAEQAQDSSAQKQALASAVFLLPDSLEARYELGMLLLSRQDYTWAAEHLTVALSLATLPGEKALVSYYLGYAEWRLGHGDQATSLLREARAHLPSPLDTRAAYFLGVLAMERGDGAQAKPLLDQVAGSDQAPYASDSQARLRALNVFSHQHGLGAALSASLGFDSHPLSDFVDGSDNADKGVALKSIFRGDVLWSFGKRRVSGLVGLTAYRDQTYTELGSGDVQSDLDATDFNLTLLLGQAGIVGLFDTGRVQHRLKLTAEGELQIFDSLPEETYKFGSDNTPVASWTPGEAGFGAQSLGVKLAWAMAYRKEAITELRLMAQVRPNYIEEDRSTSRYSLGLVHTRSFLDRSLQARGLLGLRYDRSFYDPTVVKYDRILPEAVLDLDWRTPVPRLSASLGATVKYNWYLNSRTNATNSFRPNWHDVPALDLEENDAREAQYYDVTRGDFEWELRAEVSARLWKNATLALPYKHHARISNLDGLPYSPDVNDVPVYGYDQDVISLELRQVF